MQKKSNNCFNFFSACFSFLGGGEMVLGGWKGQGESYSITLQRDAKQLSQICGHTNKCTKHDFTH